MLSLMLTDIMNRLNLISEMMQMDSQKLVKLKEDFETECSNLQSALEAQKPKIMLSITEMKQEAEYWMYEFFTK
ncbi:MAG: hypothetical protein IIU49_00230, partial [Spirochaetales bacterium]|nr:hypothetical protein [Spirochaetales bacterium]